MTRQELIDLGVDEAVVEKIMRLHGKTVNPLKESNEKLAADNGRLSSDLAKAQGEIKTTNEKHEKDMNDLTEKHNAEVEARETAEKELASEKAAHSATKDGFAKKETDAAIDKVYSDLLTQSGFRPDLVDKEIKLADREALVLGKDGKLKDSDKVLADAKSRWPNDFATSAEKGATTFRGNPFAMQNATPPTAGGNKAMNAFIRAGANIAETE